MNESKIELTGNPFVDTGLGVIAALAKLDDIDDLTISHLKLAYGDGEKLVRWNSKFKAFTQIFGTNNPLFQSSYGFKKGKGPSRTNEAIYKRMLELLLSEIGKPAEGPRCWACGCPSDFDFAKICKTAVEDNEKKASGDKWVGRDWFPLAGSLGSDAQALPAASKPPHICPKCLFAIHYLPQGLILLNGRLAAFQCTSTDFWYELVRNIVNTVSSRANAENYETLGSKEGSRAVVMRLLTFFKELQTEKKRNSVPNGTAFYVWRFSNSGTSPDCALEEIPNPGILFLWETARVVGTSEVEYLIGSEGKNPRYSLFECIRGGRDYSSLYPAGKWKGASPNIFALYQMYVRNHSARALRIVHKIAKEVAAQISEKELKHIQRPEAFRKRAIRTQVRAIMVKLAGQGEFTLNGYLDLFPLKEGNGIAVEWNGWDLVRYYLHHAQEDFPKMEEKQQITNKACNAIVYYAAQIYNHYLDEKGKERFQREVLAKMGREIGISWLRQRFVQLAESEDGFTYGHWSKICKLDDGHDFVSELLFQMRLLWTQWAYENRTQVDAMSLMEDSLDDKLSPDVSTLVKAVFADYVDKWGLDRFYWNVLLRLRRREIGLFWFKNRFVKRTYENIQSINEEDWENFLVNDVGQSINTERQFQLHLALANLYKTRRRDDNAKVN